MRAFNRAWAGLLWLSVAFASEHGSVLAAGQRLPRSGSASRPLEIETVEGLERMASVEVSPDGKRIAVLWLVSTPKYTETSSELERGSVSGRLRIIDADTGISVFDGGAQADYASPRWSPDGRFLAFYAGRGAHARLRIWSLDSGEAHEVSGVVPRTLPSSLASKPVWLSDGRRLLIAALPKNGSDDGVERSRRNRIPFDVPAADTHGGEHVRIYQSVEFARRHNATAGTRVGQPAEYAALDLYSADLTMIDVVTGQTRRVVTGHHPLSYVPSPDGRTVSYLDTRGSVGGNVYRSSEVLSVVDLATGHAKDLLAETQGPGIPTPQSWSADGRWLAWVMAGNGGDGGCTFIDASTHEEVSVGGLLREELNSVEGRTLRISPVLWATSSEGYLLTGDATESKLWHIRIAAKEVTAAVLGSYGSKEVLSLASFVPDASSPRIPRGLLVRTRDRVTDNEGFGVISLDTGRLEGSFEQAMALGDDATFSERGGLLAFSAERSDAPPELFVSRSPFVSFRQVTHVNANINGRFGKAHLIHWTGPDGEPLRGALLLPPDFSASRTYPVITVIYGGSRLSDQVNSFGLNGLSQPTAPFDNQQLLATRGYVVLLADTQARQGRPMSDIAQSVLPAIDLLIAQGIADPGRLGIMGHSYGGYSVLCVLVQTGRFKAAVVAAGSSNLIDSYSAMTRDGMGGAIGWVETYQGRMGGSVWEHRARFIENSPFFYLDRVTTPVLIMTGTADVEVPVHESDELFLSLNRLGKNAQYVQYVGEGHNISGSQNVDDWWRRRLEWFDSHLQ